MKLELDPAPSYSWNDGSNASSKIISEPVDLWVIAHVGNCSASDRIKVGFVDCELQLPNFFSPNEDGYNKYFIPSQMSGITAAQLSIYNRWGTELYYTRSFSFLNGWDGTCSKEPASGGVYFWKVEYIDIENNSHIIRGIVTLER